MNKGNFLVGLMRPTVILVRSIIVFTWIERAHGMWGKIIFSLSAPALAVIFLIQAAPSQAESPIWGDQYPSQPKLSQTNPVSGTLQLDQHVIYLPYIAHVNNIPKPLGSLADGWYLMVDDGHIVYHDIQRIYHPFQKYPNNPILRADKPWEGRVVQLYGTVLPGFRMWYSIVNADGPTRQIAYAESNDGLNWHKPSLDGQGSNVLLGTGSANLISGIHTPQDISKPFKFMVNQYYAFQGYWSRDGIQLNAYIENPLFDNGSDVAQFYWDPNTRRYGGTAKERTDVRGIARRVVRFIDSDDFINWTSLPELFVPDIIDDQIYEGFYPHFYGFPVFPSGEQYLGLLWVLKARDLGGYYGQTTIQLVSSHDGIHWIREEGNRPSILDVGPPGSWDGGQIYTAIQPIKVGDELWLYYSGCNLEHGEDPHLVNTVCHIGLATAPYNRLGSLTGTGIILTDSLSPSGSQLHLNYNGSEGSISVELLRSGVTIPGYEAENCVLLSENNLDQIVTWSGQTYLPDGSIQIRFHLQNSSLYAFSIQ